MKSNFIWSKVWQRRMRTWVSLVLLLPLASASADETEAVKGFKDFLSRPVCVKGLKFTKVQRPPAPQLFYVGAACGDDFFIRPFIPGRDANFTVSLTNPAPVGYFVGESGNKKWAINGLTITEASVGVDATTTDQHTSSVGVGEYEIQSLLAMGPNLLKPGTFVWDGNRFRASTTPLMRNSSYQLAELQGEVLVRNGVVAELRISDPLSQVYLYEYDKSKGLPPGIPSKIIAGPGDSQFDWKYLIETLEIVDSIQDASYFLPYRHIDSNIVAITVISNGARVSIRDNTMAVIRERQRLITQESPIRLFGIRLLLVAVCVTGIVWGWLRFRKGRQDCHPLSMK